MLASRHSKSGQAYGPTSFDPAVYCPLRSRVLVSNRPHLLDTDSPLRRQSCLAIFDSDGHDSLETSARKSDLELNFPFDAFLSAPQRLCGSTLFFLLQGKLRFNMANGNIAAQVGEQAGQQAVAGGRYAISEPRYTIQADAFPGEMRLPASLFSPVLNISGMSVRIVP